MPFMKDSNKIKMTQSLLKLWDLIDNFSNSLSMCLHHVGVGVSSTGTRLGMGLFKQA